MKAIIAVPATLLLVYRAGTRKSLTPLGIVVATATATAHAIHPWSVFFALLVVFFLGGTTVTKVKHDVKARLTLSSSGSSGGEGPRTHVQVLANSLVASVLILAHARQLYLREVDGNLQSCWSWRGDLLVVGIVANYAAVAADTFSSELGILSKSSPRLLTSPTLRKVPPGTNGGVTPMGVLAGFLGSSTIAITSALLLPFCGATYWPLSSTLTGQKRGDAAWSSQDVLLFILAVTIWGGLGSLLDSFLGGWLQASVVDLRTGKIVEGTGGKKVLVRGPDVSSVQYKGRSSSTASPGSGGTVKETRHRSSHNSSSSKASQGKRASRKVESGLDLLDNNAVNLLMALIMSLGGMMAASWYWHVPLMTVLA